MLLLVLAAAGVAGVLYWRRSLEASKAPVAAAADPAKHGKERRRKRRGVRRLARNEVFVTSGPSGEAPPGEAPPDEGPPPGAYAPSRREGPAPVAPGGASTTEVAPAEVFGPLTSPTAAPAGGRRQPIDEPEPIKLRPADLKMVWQGEDLSRAENVTLDFSKDAVGHELSQDEIDARFRTKEAAVISCVTRAHPDASTYVPGHVTVKFRIQRTGAVKGVQVEAPVILHRGGLTGCIKGVVSSLRFPASNMSQVITYPFSLM